MWYFTWILGTWFAASFAILLALWQEVHDPSSPTKGYDAH